MAEYGATTPRLTARADRIATGAGVIPPNIWAILIQLLTSLLGGICPTPKAKADYVNTNLRVVDGQAQKAARGAGYRRRQAKQIASAVVDDVENNPVTEDEVTDFAAESQS